MLHVTFHRGAETVASGSGFVAGGHVITNNHVFGGPRDTVVRLWHHPDECVPPKELISLSFEQFAARLVVGSDRNAHDFAILSVPEVLGVLPDLHLRHPHGLSVGDPTFFLGYPLEHDHLVCHSGTVSSLYMSGPASVIQVDASVNQSNSGGPLFDLDTGDVIGVVTRKATGLSRLFTQLQELLDENIEVLTKLPPLMKIGGFEPVKVFLAQQHQMRRLADEIVQSANVGIGYAFSVDSLGSELDRLAAY